jgi:hypothetical protein
MRNFGRSASMAILDRLHSGGHFFKAGRVLLSILVKHLSEQIASGD